MTKYTYLSWASHSQLNTS